jgi:hypothetical protein
MAYVETLLVLPVVLLLILGLADFSFVMKDYLVAGNAASEAARTATLYQAPCDPSAAAAGAEANARVLLAAGGVKAAEIRDIDVEPQPGQTLCDRGMVGVSIDVRSELPLLSGMYPLSFGPIDFTATATALNENGN